MRKVKRSNEIDIEQDVFTLGLLFHFRLKSKLSKLSSARSPDFSTPATFGIFGRRGFLFAMMLALAAVFLFFLMFPAVDIAVSRLFFAVGACNDAAQCGGFPAAESTGFAKLRSVLYAMPFVVPVAILLVKTLVFIKQKISPWRDAPVTTAIIASLFLGPGLLVNGLLKEHIPRSRPRDVSLFGGDFPFVPVGQLHGMCNENCSFVSGEAAIAPLMVLSVLLFPKSWQKPALLILLPVSLLMAFLRVIVGAHYVSDAMLGYGLTFLVFSILAQLISRFWVQKN